MTSRKQPRPSLYKVPISVDELQEGMVMAETFHVKNKEGVNMMFSWVGTRLTERHIEKLKSHQVSEVKIFSDSPTLPQPEKYIFSASTKPQDDDKIHTNKLLQPGIKLPESEPTIKNDLRDQAINSIRNLFDATKESLDQNGNMTTAYQAVKGLDNLVYQLVNVLTLDTSGLVHINNLKSYDEYTYHHSLSVAVLSVAIGQALGFDNQELKSLCRCAILHDIGKMLVPIGLITKPGQLDANEFNIVKTHAEQGGQLLKSGVIGGIDLWLGVAFHHEKVDGTGYPRRLKKDEIPLFSRIISVADVYDAVTSYRPYRDPMVPCNALELIMSGTDTSFDFDIVQAFKQKLELYPVNTIVELSDKRVGIVIDNSNAKRPVIQILNSDAIVDLAGLRNLSLVITQVYDSKKMLLLG